MAPEKPNLGAAISAAFLEDFDPDAGTEPEGSEAPAESDTPGANEGAQADVEPQADSGAESEATDEASSEGTEDVPDRYFEVDLSGLPAEERKAVIDALKGRDDEIGKLLRGRAEGETDPDSDAGEVNEPPAPVELTDESILQALGLDPESPFDEVAAKVALPLVRSIETLTQQVSSLVEDRELEQLGAYWDTELDKLEAANGELPIERVALLEFAASNGLTNPTDAYWRVAGPGRRQVEEAVAAAQKRVAQTGGTPPKPKMTRPTTSSAEADVEVKGKGVGKAVESVATKVLQDLGFDL